MRKPEAAYTTAVNALVKELGSYSWKISDKFTSGIFDNYYSGDAGELFIEYKWLEKFPAEFTPDLSDLQLEWGLSRQAEGRNTWVVVGSREGGVLLKTGWHLPVTRPTTLLTKRDIAQEIYDQCGQRQFITLPHRSKRRSTSRSGPSTPQPKSPQHFPTPPILSSKSKGSG